MDICKTGNMYEVFGFVIASITVILSDVFVMYVNSSLTLNLMLEA